MVWLISVIYGVFYGGKQVASLPFADIWAEQIEQAGIQVEFTIFPTSHSVTQL